MLLNLGPRQTIGFVDATNGVFPVLFQDNEVYVPKNIFLSSKHNKDFDIQEKRQVLGQLKTIHDTCNEDDQARRKKAKHEISIPKLEEIVRELTEVGWDKVLQVEDSFENGVFELKDEKKRVYLLEINLVTRQCLAHWMPLPFSSNFKSLKEIIIFFENQIQRFQTLWDELDELDGKCKILDPPLPTTRAITRRRLAIFDVKTNNPFSHLFLEIHLSPGNTNKVPCAVDIIGIDNLVQVWKPTFEKYTWNTSLNILQNLTNAFESLGYFAIPETKETDSMNEKDSTSSQPTECGVCYVYRLDDYVKGTHELPDESCSNCKRPFHRSCVVGWLRALPSAKRSSKILVGECPYCGNSMTVKAE